MPRGASPKREHEYQKLKHEFKKSGRYAGREKEVAARIVNKQRAALGETKQAKHERGARKSGDGSLPISDYPRLTIAQIRTKLGRLSSRELESVKRYEQRHKHRKTLLEVIERHRHA